MHVHKLRFTPVIDADLVWKDRKASRQLLNEIRKSYCSPNFTQSQSPTVVGPWLSKQEALSTAGT